jgi:hypothetical protein
MMRSTGKIVAVMVFAAWSGSISAMPITDTVTADGKEWAQVDLFLNLSWYDINAVCPEGVCSDGGMLNGYDMTGWLWAG